MFKYIAVFFAVIACAAAKPGLVAPLAYSAPLVAPGVVTATSSQVIARNYNGIAAAPVLAAAPLAARYVASPLAAPLAARYIASPLAAPLAAPLGAPLAASLAGPLAYSAPLVANPLGLAAPALW